MQKKTYLIFAGMLFSSLCFAQGNVNSTDSTNITNSVDSTTHSTHSVSSYGTLKINSPEPAGVWVNELAVGTTPFSMDLPIGWAVYSVRSPGYWSEVFLSNIGHRMEVLQEVKLKEYGQPTYEALNRELLQTNDVRALESLYDSLHKQEPSATPDSICLAHFVATYPLPIFAPEPLNENSHEYRNYYNTYVNERQLSFEDWYSSCSDSAIQQNLNIILARINQLGNKQLSGFVPVVGAKFEPIVATNGLKGNLELHFRSPDGRADVFWKGAWENDFLAGDELVRALTASTPVALSFLTTQNQAVWVPIEAGYSRHFYKYYKLNISWNGLLFPLTGEFILPNYITAQPVVAQWLDSLKAPPAPKDSISIAQDSIKEQIPIDVPDVPVSAPVDLAMLAKIPGGTFEYKGKNTDVKQFFINTREINQRQYQTKCGDKDFGKYKNDSLPAHSVTWKEANSCCIALGGELPTEAEWEYAARAGNPYDYIWDSNENVSDYAVFNSKKPEVSAKKKPNGWGLYDMFGNVAEWVKDDGFWFGKYKYLKGGSWKSSKEDLKVKNSEEEDTRYWGTHVGFRCVFK